MTYRKKLIEVALPLEAINREAAREKSIRHGHPPYTSGGHGDRWQRVGRCCSPHWSMTLLAGLKNFQPRKNNSVRGNVCLGLIEELVKWENVNDKRVLGEARAEILKSTDGNPPPVLDPFCGGGSIPLEAQRLGLEAHGSDLNPVAVLITKAMIEIPPRFTGQPPVNPNAQGALVRGQIWKGSAGLAEDVRYYGEWIRQEAERRIGHLYPKVQLPKEHGGGEGTVIAWLWARTVQCPNPACGAWMPLVRSFWLSTNKRKKAWIEPIVNKVEKTVRFEVKRGNGVPPERTVDRRGARCIVCDGVSPLGPCPY